MFSRSKILISSCPRSVRAELWATCKERERKKTLTALFLATFPLTHSYTTYPTSAVQFRSVLLNSKRTTPTTENCLYILGSYIWSAKKINKLICKHTDTYLESVSKHVPLSSNSLEFSFSLFTVISDPVLEFRGLKLPLETSQLLLSLYLKHMHSYSQRKQLDVYLNLNGYFTKK